MKSKFTLHLAPVNGGAFNCLPAREVELNVDRILCNDVVLPWESHPHHVKLWVIGNEFGAVGAVWASCEKDALDELIDYGFGDSFLVDKDDYAQMSQEEKDECTPLGNAGEPCDLTYAWMQPVQFDKARDCELLCTFAEARGNGANTLDN